MNQLYFSRSVSFLCLSPPPPPRRPPPYSRLPHPAWPYFIDFIINTAIKPAMFSSLFLDYSYTRLSTSQHPPPACPPPAFASFRYNSNPPIYINYFTHHGDGNSKNFNRNFHNTSYIFCTIFIPEHKINMTYKKDTFPCSETYFSLIY